jgi:UDP-glucose 4-epimerase
LEKLRKQRFLARGGQSPLPQARELFLGGGDAATKERSKKRAILFPVKGRRAELGTTGRKDVGLARKMGADTAIYTARGKREPLPVYGKGENVRDWLYVEDHARAIDIIFHTGKIADTYNIGGFNEWKNIDLIKVIIKTVDRLLGNPEGHSFELITYVTDRQGHDLRYAIDSRKLKNELGWEPSLQFEEGIEKTVRWYLDNEEWMNRITSGDYARYYEDMYAGR